MTANVSIKTGFTDISINMSFHSNSSELSEKLTNAKKLASQKLQKVGRHEVLIHTIIEDCVLQLDRLKRDFDLAEEQLKETMSELRSTEAAEQEQLAELRTALRGPAVATLMTDIDQHIHNARSCEAAAARAREQVVVQQQRLASISSQCKQLSSHYPSLLHQTRKKMDVYSCLTRIKWKYNSPENEVCGFIARPDKKEVIPFTLDTNSTSQYFITDYLWSQLALSSSDFL